MHALAKFVGFVLEPLHLVLIAALIAALSWSLGFRQLARIAGGGALAFVIIVGLTPVSAWSLRALEDRFPAPGIDADPIDMNAIDGVIVLGGATDDGALAERRQTYLLGEAAERLTTAIGLRRRHPEPRIVISGFSAAVRPNGLSEGEITRRLMADLGADPSTFIFEERSRNTFENAIETRRLIGDPQGPWLLVTSAFHIPRAVGVFEAVGFDVIPYPVDYRVPSGVRIWWPPDVTARFNWARIAMKEWVGLASYRLLGRTESWLPG